MVPLIVPGLTWLAPAAGSQTSAEGYRVTGIRTAAGLRYVAWAPPERPELSYWQWYAQAPHASVYAIGQSPPQRIALLGVFTSATEARDCCERHAATLTTPSTDTDKQG